MELHTDASAIGLAGMLLHRGEDEKMRMVYCVSEKTTDVEKTYHSSKLELMAVVWCLDRLRPLVMGIHVVVVTDCQTLVYLNSFRTKNSQIARCYELLQEYDIEVKHRAGTRMEHVDALSRAPVNEPHATWDEILENRLEVVLTMSEENYVRVMQYSDPELRQTIEEMKNACSELSEDRRKRLKNFRLKEGMLYFHGETGQLRWMVPKRMRKAIVVKFHGLVGHFSIDRTISNIARRYYFPGMR
ncbi:uncharacterized protein [Rhodnius prolixus]|uniref:uncharacterized protein n=1 Tax=Rhodnius prolixus TaxID=13249 RepID=UPI003D188FC5